MLFGVERQKRRGCLEVHKNVLLQFLLHLLASLPSVSYPTHFGNTQQLHCIKNVYKKLWSIWGPGDILHCYFKALACRHKQFLWLRHFSVALHTRMANPRLACARSAVVHIWFSKTRGVLGYKQRFHFWMHWSERKLHLNFVWAHESSTTNITYQNLLKIKAHF